MTVQDASAYVPRVGTWSDYYAATDAKHFGAGTSGSKFAPELSRLEDVVALAIEQRGNLDGDDQQRFITAGASKDAFTGSSRYLYVETPGLSGVVPSDSLDPNTLLSIVRTKPGVPCSLTVAGERQAVGYATLIVAECDDEAGTGTRAITAFPGLPTVPPYSEWFDRFEGAEVTVALAHDVLGRDFWVEVR